jgi:NAD-dependent DNA ligase
MLLFMLLLLCMCLQSDLMTLPLFGDKKAQNALAAIQASRDMDLATLLAGLGIE